jgi:hypothetical protein
LHGGAAAHRQLTNKRLYENTENVIANHRRSQRACSTSLQQRQRGNAWHGNGTKMMLYSLHVQSDSRKPAKRDERKNALSDQAAKHVAAAAERSRIHFPLRREPRLQQRWRGCICHCKNAFTLSLA